MSVKLYMDEHVPSAITEGVRQRGADVLTIQEDGAGHSPDPRVLDRATRLDRVVVTNDSDFKVMAALRQRKGEHFSGVIYVDLTSITIGRCIADLELICAAGEPADFSDRVEYLPL